MTDNSINQAFEAECREQIALQGDDQKLTGLARDFFNESAKHKYSYHFSWMGRPIIQLPQDMMAMQEIIWQVKPDLVIECGIAHGGGGGWGRWIGGGFSRSHHGHGGRTCSSTSRSNPCPSRHSIVSGLGV